MLLTRKRRADAVRGKLLEAVAKTEGLGLTVVGVYDALVYASTSSWVDARGATSGGPTITLTGSPTLSNGVYTFNGTDQYGRNASAGRLSEMSGDDLLLVTGYLSYTPATTSVNACLSNTATAILQSDVTTTPTVRGTVASGAPSTAAVAGGANGVVRVHHAWRIGQTVGSQLGSGTPATVTAGAYSATGVNRLTVAGSSLATPGSLAAVSLRFLVAVRGVGAGTLTTAQAIWNQYGALRGATL